MEEEVTREQMVFWTSMGLYATWVLLPVIPAILIYWLFPKNTLTARGVLAGLTVNASGAFGGYLVIFTVTYPFVHQNQNTIGVFMHPYWTVTGEIKLVNYQTGVEMHSELLLDKLNIVTKPEIMGNKSFRMRAALPEQDGGIPWLVFTIPNFGTAVIDVGAASKEVNYYQKTVHLTDPIEIKGDSSIKDVPVIAEKN
jgi:hypothetical protein